MQDKTLIIQGAKNISKIVHQLMEHGPVVRGSFNIAYRKCGKVTCWCAQPGTTGHPYARITWKEDGKTRSKTVSEEDITQIRQMATNYQEFRSLRKQLRDAEDRMEALLNEYERELPR
jgi:hypothetical protein